MIVIDIRRNQSWNLMKCKMCEEILYAALPQRTDDNFPMRLDKVLRVRLIIPTQLHL